MAENIFAKWDNANNLANVQKSIEEAKKGNGNRVFKEVPVGTYEVKLYKADLKPSSTDKPMVSLGFKVLVGEYKDEFIWMNQVVEQGFQIKIAKDFLESLDSGVRIGKFTTYSAFKEDILDVFEACNGKLEFALEYGVNNKGFKTFKITDVFEVE